MSGWELVKEYTKLHRAAWESRVIDWEPVGNRLGTGWESTGNQARKLSGAVQLRKCRYFFSRAKALVASASSTHTRLLSVWALQRLILESPIEQPLPNPKMPLEQEPSQ